MTTAILLRQDPHIVELAAAYERIAQLEAVLGECAAWLDQRAAIVDGEPNEEMQMMCFIDGVL